MSEYLIEFYLSRAEAAEVERNTERVRLAAADLTREGTPVRQLLAIFVPEDETCFLLCEAASAEAVHETARRANLSVDRISEALVTSHVAQRICCAQGNTVTQSVAARKEPA